MWTTAIQLGMMEFMERHEDLTKPQSGPAGRIEVQRKCLRLVEALNVDVKGEVRNVEKLKKFQSFYRHRQDLRQGRLREARTPGSALALHAAPAEQAEE